MRKLIQRIPRAIRRVRGWYVEQRAKRAFRRQGVNRLRTGVDEIVAAFLAKLAVGLTEGRGPEQNFRAVETYTAEWRKQIRAMAGLSSVLTAKPRIDDLVAEISFLMEHREALAPVFRKLATRRVLFSGQAYYNAWYLSRALRNRGWKADLLNWDENPSTQIYYHGEDFRVGARGLAVGGHQRLVPRRLRLSTGRRGSVLGPRSPGRRGRLLGRGRLLILLASEHAPTLVERPSDR